MKDFTWDVVGTATGLLAAWAVDRLFESVKSDRAQLGQRALPVGAP